MSVSPQDHTDHGLVYFGRMTASISHDIKNYLAIINENAGLMQDLSMMASMGKQLDPDRVLGLCKNIITQIKRADDTIKSMNSFGHSTDKPVVNICLYNTINLAMSIGTRILRSREVEVKLQVPEGIFITTKPFVLMNLLWLIVEYLAECLSDNTNIFLSAAKGDKTVVLSIVCYGQDTESAVQSLLSMDSVDLLLCSLNGRLEAGDENVLLITLPESLGQVC